MDFEVYCDESGIEALYNKESHSYVAIGGIWLPSFNRTDMKQSIEAIRNKHKNHSEFKWNKVSPNYLPFYKDVINYFFTTPYLRFRAVLIESSKVNNVRFNNEDGELGFYKFYYQLLHHWIFDFNTYTIFADLKINKDKNRLKELKEILENSNMTSLINNVQGLPSDELNGIQIADLLTGLVNAKFNNEITGEAKKALIEFTESCLGKQISPTPKWAEKFNVFKINLKGGW